MARQKGSMKVRANFEVSAASPLDARYVVPTLADLTDSTTWISGGMAYVYRGMQVYVNAEQKLYMLTANNFTTMDNWKEIVSSTNILIYKGSVTTYSALPLSGMVVGDIYYVTDEEVNYYWNGTSWVQMGSPDKSSYVWNITSSLGTLKAAVTLPVNNLKRSDDATIVATIDDIIAGKTIVTDIKGIVGVVSGISATTTITGMTIANLVLNETLLYDADGTIGVVTGKDIPATGDLTVTTITKIRDKIGDSFITSAILDTIVGNTTIIPIANISGLTLDAVVDGNTLIADAAATLGVVSSHTTTDIVVKTLTRDTKTDGIYITTQTLDETTTHTTTVNVSDITGIVLADIVVNETIIYDIKGTVAKVNSVDTTTGDLVLETITSSGSSATKLKHVLNSTQKVGGINIGDSFPAGTGFEDLWRALLDPIIKPTFTNPSATLSVNGSKLLEKGSTVSKTFTCTFNRGTITPAYTTSGYRSGPATGYILNGGTSQATNTWTETVSESLTSYVAAVTYSAGEQPVDSSGANYDLPYPAGSVASNTIVFEFVDALWANTTNIANIAKLSLVSKSSKSYEFNFPAQTVANPEVFDVPSSWTITKIEVYNELSGKYQDVASEFTKTTTTHNDAAGTSVNYNRYTDNRGYSAGTRKIKITWN